MAKPGAQHNPTIESLKDRIARDPLSRAFLQLAEEYRREGRYQEAIDVCLEGLQRHPTYHTARISLGRTYMEGGDAENARRAFVEVLELQPENHLAAKLLAEIQTKMGDLAGAAATYRDILRYYPNDREVVTLLEETLRRGPAPAAPARSAAIAAPASPRMPPVPAPPAPRRAAPAPVVSPPPAGAPPGQARSALARAADPPPDFRPEDFGGAATTPARDSRGAPAAGGAPSWPGPSSDPAGSLPDDDALQTNTLAELYLRQGLVDRAIEVYRGMLRVDPGNRRAARRLDELAPAGASAPPPDIAAPAGPAVRERAPSAAPAGTVAPGVEARRDAVLRLERWLASISGTAANLQVEAITCLRWRRRSGGGSGKTRDIPGPVVPQ